MELAYELYDGTKYTEEIAKLATGAYMFNNPFLKPLGITQEQMYKEFLHTLRSRAFRWVFIYFERESYLEGFRTIVGCMMWGDIVDFKPKGDAAKVVNFARAPTSTLVRQYMRHRSLQPLFKKYNPKEGQMAYGSGFGLNPKFMGQGPTSYKMFKIAVEHLVENGYNYGCGHAINEIAKRVFQKSHLVDQYDIDVTDMYVNDTQELPFKDMGLSQQVFLGQLPKTVSNLGHYIEQRARL